MYQEESSQFTHDGSLYDLNTVLQLSAAVPVRTVEVSKLAWSCTPADKATTERALKTNLQYPILVTDYKDKLVTVDGYHRLLKAIKIGVKFLPCKHISADILAKAKIS